MVDTLKEMKSSVESKRELYAVINKHIITLEKDKRLLQEIKIVDYWPPIHIKCILWPWLYQCRCRPWWFCRLFPWLCPPIWWPPWPPWPPWPWPPPPPPPFEVDPIVTMMERKPEDLIKYLEDKPIKELTPDDVLHASIQAVLEVNELVQKNIDIVNERLRKI